MDKGRLEAFSDGVIAIIITIMVLELRAPAGSDLGSLRSAIAPLLTYLLSFVYVGIYWNNHHHMLHAVRRVSGSVLWANLHLLFWLSLIPFVTDWMNGHGGAPAPIAAYGAVLLMAAIAYYILARCLAAANGKDSLLATAFGHDLKGLSSIAIYATGIALSYWRPPLALAMYVLVAALWVVPDRRIEKQLSA